VTAQSAGTLLWRRRADGVVEVLIVRPSGPAARHGWSLPKGLPNAGEPLEQAARRETLEEVGVDASGVTLTPLGHVDYVKSKKRVYAFAGEAPVGCEPRVASWEISAARFVSLEEAAAVLHADQRAFIERLRRILVVDAL
jgi:predicted NUDIX family NTP pyrophosphohydrolase